MRGRWLLIIAFLFAVTGVYAQETRSGYGVVTEAGWDGSVFAINPYGCFSSFCERVKTLLYPNLFATEAVSGAIVPASNSARGLVVSQFDPSKSLQRLTLRDDLVWSDGIPITAYDVFFSILADAYFYDVYTREIQSIRVIDAITLEMQFYSADCSIPSRINLPIVPAHVVDPEFVQNVSSFDFDGDITERLYAFYDSYPMYRFDALQNIYLTNAVTAGDFVIDDIRPDEALRFRMSDGDVVYVSPYPSGDGVQDGYVQAFLNGETNLLVNPILNRRAELEALGDVQIATYPSRSQVVLAFNFANPDTPKPAFDTRARLLDQGKHPMFSDVRVRQAIQKAIDVETLIDYALLGYGTPTASYQLPTSWSFNPDLTVIQQNLDEARQLLYDAGWRDNDRDGILNCVTCLDGEENMPFQVSMNVNSSNIYGTGDNLFTVATLIQEQLRAVGIGVSLTSDEPSQAFDLYLTQLNGFISDPDPSRLLSRLADRSVLGNGNVGSYYNEDVEALMEKARNISSCSITERAPLYQELDRLLQQDLPYVWLFAPNEMVVSRGILGAVPTARNPIWNINDWRVQR